MPPVHKLHKHLHRRIIIQILIIAVAAIFLLVAVAHDAVIDDIGLGMVALGLAIGLIVGFLSGRMFNLKWHPDTEKVIMTMDAMSFVVIGLYIAFRIFGTQLLGDYLHGEALTAFTFALLGGLLLGRLVSMARSIKKIFDEEGI